MESPSPRRFHSGGGYTGFNLADDFRSNVDVNHQSPSHAPSPSRLSQQQLAQRMMQTDYEDNEQMHIINSSYCTRNEAYDSYNQSSRQNYNFGHDTMDEADFIPPWDTAATAPPTIPEMDSRKDYVQRVAERTMLRQQSNSAPTFHDAFANNSWENTEATSPQTQMFLSPSQHHLLSPRSTKNVSFNTRDKIHQWDDQFEQLKHVDEEFLAAAKYLLEDVHNVTDDYLEKEEEYFEALYSRQNGKVTKKGGGIFAKLFQCGATVSASGNGEGSFEGNSYKPYLGVDGEILDDGSGLRAQNQRKKKYKLTHKLVKDFKAALKYRIDALENENHEEEDEESIAAKTREIARKVEAYGLPKPWESEISVEEDQDVEKEGLKEYSVESLKSDKNRQQRNETHFFPLLPMDNDDANTIDPTKYFTPENKPHILSLLSSIFKSKSMPTEVECQQHLYRIGLEIQKVNKMNATTHNVAVQSACARRIAKLNDEKRFYQIIKEQHKIRHMYKKTKREGVKFACKERIKQLMLELETLDLEREEDITIEDQQDVKGSEGRHWYERALHYVNATNDLQHQDQYQSQPQQELEQDHYQENNPRYDNQTHQYSQSHQWHPKNYHNNQCNISSINKSLHSYQHQNYPQNQHNEREMERLVHHTQHASYQPQHHNAKVFRQMPPQQPIHSPLHVHQVYNNINHPQEHSQGNSRPNRSNTAQRLPLATALPPKKEGLSKLISYLAPD